MVRYSKVVGEDPFEVLGGPSESSDVSGDSESETDFSEDERERKLLALQEQLRQVQEQMKVGPTMFLVLFPCILVATVQLLDPMHFEGCCCAVNDFTGRWQRNNVSV